MKKLILSLIVALTSVTGLMAQSITVTEPEFAEETLLLTSDSQGVKLSRENGTTLIPQHYNLTLFISS